MIVIENRMVITRDWEEGRIKSYFLMGRELYFCKMERVLEMDGGKG